MECDTGAGSRSRRWSRCWQGHFRGGYQRDRWKIVLLLVKEVVGQWRTGILGWLPERRNAGTRTRTREWTGLCDVFPTCYTLITCHSPKPTNSDKGRPQDLHEFVLDTTNSSCAQAQWERVQRRCRWSVVQCAEIQGWCRPLGRNAHQTNVEIISVRSGTGSAKFRHQPLVAGCLCFRLLASCAPNVVQRRLLAHTIPEYYAVNTPNVIACNQLKQHRLYWPP